MQYLVETFYIHQEGFDVIKAIEVTAQSIAQWANYYQVKIHFAEKKVTENEKTGPLPEEKLKKSEIAGELLQWVSKNSKPGWEFDMRFVLSELPEAEKPIFAYYDGPWNMSLELHPDEFKELQEIWKLNNLPEDLFFPLYQQICILLPPGKFVKFLNMLGLNFQSQRCLSPKEWELEKTKYENYPRINKNDL
ncbi:MAG: hypothetical protein WDN47_03890 [Candidatus Doudnabacteria bacterium]